jgi:hypothetical protein
MPFVKKFSFPIFAALKNNYQKLENGLSNLH